MLHVPIHVMEIDISGYEDPSLAIIHRFLPNIS
jgi:hypothetical protein